MTAHAPTMISADAIHASDLHQHLAAPQRFTPPTNAVEKTPATATTTERAHAGTETANATPTTAAATASVNVPEAIHEPTKATPEPGESRKYPEMLYHRLRQHPKSKKKRAKSSNATPPRASRLAPEAAAETHTVGATLHHLRPDEATVNAPALHPAALPTNLLLPPTRGETAAAVPLESIDTCLAEGLLVRLLGETVVVIVRGTRKNAGEHLIDMFLVVARGTGVNGVGVGLLSSRKDDWGGIVLR